jgi:hypothetical protein
MVKARVMPGSILFFTWLLKTIKTAKYLHQQNSTIIVLSVKKPVMIKMPLKKPCHDKMPLKKTCQHK